MIPCPACGGVATTVKDSRPVGNSIRRRRECGDCGRRTTTYEMPVAVLDAMRSDHTRRIEAATQALRAALDDMGTDAPEVRVNHRAPSRQPSARNMEITRRRDAGEAATTIGRDYGITGERVRQIVNRTRTLMGLTEGE